MCDFRSVRSHVWNALDEAERAEAELICLREDARRTAIAGDSKDAALLHVQAVAAAQLREALEEAFDLAETLRVLNCEPDKVEG